MTLLEQWRAQKRLVKAMLSAGRINPQAATALLQHLDYRIARRPQILQRRRDRKLYREIQAQHRRKRRAEQG